MATIKRFLIAAVLLGVAVTTSVAIGCFSGNVDALTETADGYYYAFDGRLVARLADGEDEIECGYPKLISEVFQGLPSDLDAAVHWPNGKTYFFKGSQYWRSTGTSVDNGYPRNIAYGWDGLPGNIDAAILWRGEQKAYLLKGTQYWRFDVSSDRLDSGYPANIAGNWGTYTGPVDAAVLWRNGHAYLFRGDEYWRYNTDQDRIDSGYPAKTNKAWFGCPL